MAACHHRTRAFFFILSIVCGIFLSFQASAETCAGFTKSNRSQLLPPAEALRAVEREASDRLKGLDSRPFDFLRDAAKGAAASIAEPGALAHEDEMNACWTRPARSLCAKAAVLLVGLLEKLIASGKPDDDKPAYAAAIGRCESALDLKPLRTLIRATE